MRIGQIKRSALCIGAGLACSMLASSAHATNLIVDPSFELGTPAGPVNTGGWSYFNGAGVSTLAAHTGTHSVDVTDGGLGAAASVPGAFEVTNIGVIPGAQYILTGYGMLTAPMAPAGSSNNGTAFAGIQATFFDSTGNNNLGTVETGANNAKFSNHLDSTSPVGQWIALSTGVFTAPAGAVTLNSYAIAVFPETTGNVLIDDLDLEQVVPEPASLGLLSLAALPILRRRRD